MYSVPARCLIVCKENSKCNAMLHGPLLQKHCQAALPGLASTATPVLLLLLLHHSLLNVSTRVAAAAGRFGLAGRQRCYCRCCRFQNLYYPRC